MYIHRYDTCDFIDLQLSYATAPMKVTICNGETLTLNCTAVNSSFSHIWNITALNVNLLANAFEGNDYHSGYNISILAGTVLVSILTVVIAEDFNGTTITCLDHSSSQVIVTAIITVLGNNVLLYTSIRCSKVRNPIF